MMSGGIPLDPDAQAFLNAAGITDATITTAIDTLVIQLKAIGVWTKMKAIYPFVGGNATTLKFNLKNPADTNAAFRLSFVGGWTHSANGIQGNGTNAYADTFLNANTALVNTSNHLSFYSRTSIVGVQIEIGCFQTPSSIVHLRAAANFYAGGLLAINFTSTANAQGFCAKGRLTFDLVVDVYHLFTRMWTLLVESGKTWNDGWPVSNRFFMLLLPLLINVQITILKVFYKPISRDNWLVQVPEVLTSIEDLSPIALCEARLEVAHLAGASLRRTGFSRVVCMRRSWLSPHLTNRLGITGVEPLGGVPLV